MHRSFGKLHAETGMTFSAGTFTYSGTVLMDGTANTLNSGGSSFNNLTIDPISAGTITLTSAGVTVSDAEVRAAQRFAFAKLQVVVEPGGAAALAAALAGKVPLDEWTVVTITGGNTDADAFARTLLTEE